jgi:hypothetical protein
MFKKALTLAALILSTTGGSCAMAAIDSEIFRLETLRINAARAKAADAQVAAFIQGAQNAL